MNLCDKLIKKYNELSLSEDKCRLYSKTGNKRYYYYNKIRNCSGVKVTIIMINPSERNSHFKTNTPDSTINNIHNILSNISVKISGKEVKISSYEIVNIYPIKSTEMLKVIQKPIDKLNEKILEYVIKHSEIIIPAWGIEEKFNQSAKILLTKIKKWSYNKNVFVIFNRYPCHFTKQCTSISRNPELVEYQFD